MIKSICSTDSRVKLDYVFCDDPIISHKLYIIQILHYEQKYI